MKKKLTLTGLLFLAALVGITNIAHAGCVSINAMTYCGPGQCVEYNGIAHCSGDEYGGIIETNGQVFCGAGRCVVATGRAYCSQYSQGDIIVVNGVAYTGPGECREANGSAHCSAQPGGACGVIDNGLIECEGGTKTDRARLGRHCALGKLQ